MKDELLRDYKFIVTIAGFASAGFNSCSGLTVKTKFTQFTPAGAITPVILPTTLDLDPIVLTRGMTPNDVDGYFWWELNARMGTIMNLLQSRQVIIECYSIDHIRDSGNFITGKNAKISYLVHNAQVQEFTAGELNADGNGIMVSRLVLIHSGLEQIRNYWNK